MGRKCFLILGLFILPYSDSIANKLNKFPYAESVLPVMVISEQSLPVLILTIFILFYVPCPAEEGSDKFALLGTWHLVPRLKKKNYYQTFL